ASSRGAIPRGPSLSGPIAASSSKITAGASSPRILRAAATLVTDATRSPAMPVSNSRRAAAHSAASSLTTNMVRSLLAMALSVSGNVLSCRLCGRRLMVRFDRQHAINFFRQLFHPERLGDMRQAVAFQELPRLRGNDVAGDEKEPLPQGIPGTLERFIEMLAVEAR